ncbi:MAG: SpoIIE family protein phosphatase [Gammaproteobacteria bacterium]
MKILVVDDNKTNIKVISGFLLKWGHSIVECYNGKDAIEKFKTESPELILMDIVMPEMNGRESAREIKKLCGSLYIPIIFVTALKSEIDIIDALDSGGDDYIGKPFDKDLLYSKINVHERIIKLNKELESKNNDLLEYNRLIKREQEVVHRFFEWGQEMCDIDSEYINFYTSPSSAYNGDIFLVKRRPSGGLYVLVGDFTGHGLTAAIGTIPVTEIFFRLAEKNVSIVDIAREINKKLHQILPVEIFFAASLMEIERNANSLCVWSGGFPDSYIINRMKNNQITTIESQHMPLGVMDESEFDATIKTYKIESGMKLYCCTDGIIESFSNNGEMYGTQRLQDVIVKNSNNTINSILNSVTEFTGGIKQKDDTTVVEVSFKELDDIDIISGMNVTRAADTLPFEINFSIQNKDMKSETSLYQIADMLGGNAELRPHKSFLYTIITELYVNALEHGILGLKSKDKFNTSAFDHYYKNKTTLLQKMTNAEVNINLLMPVSCDKIIITVTHNGKGGEMENYSTGIYEEKLYGRGLEIVKSLSNKFVYHDYGRFVEVTYLV